MNTTGIGTLAWNGAGLPKAANLPPSVHAHLRGGQALNIEIPFKIPVDAHPSEHGYVWAIMSSHAPFPGSPLTCFGTLLILARVMLKRKKRRTRSES